MPYRFCWPLILLFAVTWPVCSLAADVAETDQPAGKSSKNTIFEQTVAPLLVRHCLACHGNSDPRGGLVLTNRDSLAKGGESGAAVTPKHPEKSLLLERLADGSMPPEDRQPRPTAEEIAAVRRWIAAGANWPEGRVLSPFEFTTEQRAGLDWWSLQPVKRPPVPAAAGDADVRNPIDAFIQARLAEHGLKAAPPADRRTLIRRLSLDLTGLPPTVAEVESFLADASPNACERLVDRLLASPRYGERQARFWLDVVRYTESDGFENDKFRPHAWRYRDYVIRALNDDLPYDQFVLQQLAGDAISPLTQQSILGTGFLVAGPWDEVQNVAASQAERRRAHEEQLEELLGTISQTFLGLTVNCARCHDHKFDPILQADYYRMKAVFDGVDYAEDRKVGNRPFFTPEQIARHEARLAPLREELTGKQKLLADIASRLPAVAESVEQQGPIVAEGRFGSALNAAHTMAASPSQPGFQQPPLTVECFVRCGRPESFNVFVAQNEKSAGDHWELYSYSGKGDFSVYLPGYEPSTIRSGETVTDSQWHYLAMQFDGSRVRLYVDARQVADVAVTRKKEPAAAGQLWFGGYLPQKIGCAGLVDDVRISRGIRVINAVPTEPLRADETTLGLWSFDVAGTHRFPNRAAEVESDQLKLLLNQRDELTARIAEIEREIASQQLPLAYLGHRQQPPPTHVLLRGDISSPGDAVLPRALSAIGAPSPEFGLEADAPEAQRRLEFARWLTDDRHPLTARVMVNRMWQWRFGTGLVETSSDFGFHAGQPSHPELLDWLAAEFVESGWSIKHIQRLIVTSATWRQSATANQEAAQRDADNRLLWRFRPRRLEGEIVRDAMLSVSGELNPGLGGPSFQPWKVEVFNTHFYNLFDSGEPEYNRRTVYRANVITGRDPLLDVLDCPSPAVTTPDRRSTVTAPQALALMNDTFVQRQARQFARQIVKNIGNHPAAQVEQAVRQAWGRPPTGSEQQSLLQLASQHGLEQACWVLLNSSEFLYLK